MKKLFVILMAAASLMGMSASVSAAPKHRNVAVQTYTFNKFTLEEAIGKLKGMDIDGVEVYPWQRVSAKYPELKFGPTMNQEQRDYVKKLLKDADLKIVSYGVASPKTEKEIEDIVRFAQDMGITRIITECPVSTFPIWEKFGKETGITMCLHHHAKDSSNQYFDPEVMLKFIKGYDYVKASPDVGHWSRSQIKPIDGLKLLKGNMRSMHFKDQAEFGNPKNQCVPLGEGQLDVKAMLKELDSQGYDGWFVIEYEADWDDNLAQVKKCIEYLRKN